MLLPFVIAGFQDSSQCVVTGKDYGCRVDLPPSAKKLFPPFVPCEKHVPVFYVCSNSV